MIRLQSIEINVPAEVNFHLEFLKQMQGMKSNPGSFVAFLGKDLANAQEKTTKGIRQDMASKLKFDSGLNGLISCVVSKKPTITHGGNVGLISGGIFDEQRADGFKVTRIESRYPSADEVEYYGDSSISPRAQKEKFSGKHNDSYWRILEYGVGPYKLISKKSGDPYAQKKTWFALLHKYGMYNPNKAKGDKDDFPKHPGIKAYHFIERGWMVCGKECRTLARTAYDRYRRSRIDLLRKYKKVYRVR